MRAAMVGDTVSVTATIKEGTPGLICLRFTNPSNADEWVQYELPRYVLAAPTAAGVDYRKLVAALCAVIAEIAG